MFCRINPIFLLDLFASNLHNIEFHPLTRGSLFHTSDDRSALFH